jgi:hypothetical protein
LAIEQAVMFDRLALRDVEARAYVVRNAGNGTLATGCVIVICKLWLSGDARSCVQPFRGQARAFARIKPALCDFSLSDPLMKARSVGSMSNRSHAPRWNLLRSLGSSVIDAVASRAEATEVL